MMNLRWGVLVAVGFLAAMTVRAENLPVVRTQAGNVSGRYVVAEDGARVAVFRGIPYAAPPVGALRWKPPQPVQHWNGVRVSTSDGPWAVQNAPTSPWMGSIPASMMSEDCLYLNIFAPVRTPREPLPVIVWLHPGGLDAGSGNQELWNSGVALPRHGVVLVNVNVRLGAMGYFAHPELAAESAHHASGNYGMLDAIAALTWVRDNIRQFGGDPSRVTIAGQSGGAQKIMWLLASPLAKGLFQRAIVDAGVGARDGTLLTASGDVWSKERAEAQGSEAGKALGAATIGELRSVPWERLVALLPKPQEINPYKMHLVVDGWSLTGTPFDILRSGGRNDVPVLVGAGAGENTVLSGMAAWGAGLARARSDVYFYVFARVPPAWKAAGLSAYHGLDLPYAFGNLESLKHDYGTLVPATYPADPGVDADDRSVSEQMMTMWATFAATGNPNVFPGIEWPAFGASPGQDHYLEIDRQPRLRTAFLSKYAGIQLDDARAFPESVTSLHDGTVIVGGFGRGAVYRAKPGEDVARLWISPQASGMTNVLGVMADEKNQVLYACSVDANHAPRAVSERLSALRTFSLVDGAAGPAYPMPGGADAICNDITLAQDGTVFLTDMKGGRVLRLSPGARDLEVWAEDPALQGADGIAFADDHRLYVTNVKKHTILRIDTASEGKAGSIATLHLSTPVESPDALRLIEGSRFLLAEGGGRVDVVEIGETGAVITPCLQGKPGYTAVTLARNKAWALNGKLELRNRSDISDADIEAFGLEPVPMQCVRTESPPLHGSQPH